MQNKPAEMIFFQSWEEAEKARTQEAIHHRWVLNFTIEKMKREQTRNIIAAACFSFAFGMILMALLIGVL